MFKFWMVVEDRTTNARPTLTLEPIDDDRVYDDDLSEDQSWNRYEAQALADWQEEKRRLHI